jgi:hypothetical protein
MRKLILFFITIALSANVYAQSTLITPGNQENKNSGPDLILTSTGVPELRGQRSAGTLAVPTATTYGSNLLQINGYGHNGTVFSLSSRISFLTSEDWSSTAKGTDILFSSTKNGTTSTSEKMRITGDGYVGIGTTSPLTKLNVAGGNWDLATTNGDFAIGNFTYKLKFGVATSGAGAGDARIYTTGGTNRTILGSNATDILAITPTGVGVGTITPLRDFVVTGATPALLIGYNSTSPASNNVESGRLYFDEAVNGADRCGFEMHYDGFANRLNFNSLCSTPTSRLTIMRDNGNVGIGVLTPVNKLEVNGIIRANEVIVETGWADYVFQDDYKLKPLSEVEAFIKENKHLPSVPSAVKIQDKGAHVAELMTKMMEKIEELTLYSIEQKKEIDELKRRLDKKK